MFLTKNPARYIELAMTGNTEHRTVTANIQHSSAWGKSKVSTETKETLTAALVRNAEGTSFVQAEAGIILVCVL